MKMPAEHSPLIPGRSLPTGERLQQKAQGFDGAKRKNIAVGRECALLAREASAFNAAHAAAIFRQPHRSRSVVEDDGEIRRAQKFSIEAAEIRLGAPAGEVGGEFLAEVGRMDVHSPPNVGVAL